MPSKMPALRTFPPSPSRRKPSDSFEGTLHNDLHRIVRHDLGHRPLRPSCTACQRTANREHRRSDPHSGERDARDDVHGGRRRSGRSADRSARSTLRDRRHGRQGSAGDLRFGGQVAEIGEHMPLVLINPEIELFGKPEIGVEGCLSFPRARSDVSRPAAVRVRAESLDGKMLEFEAGGLLARAIQHEHDHLHGILLSTASARPNGRESKRKWSTQSIASECRMSKGEPSRVRQSRP